MNDIAKYQKILDFISEYVDYHDFECISWKEGTPSCIIQLFSSFENLLLENDMEINEWTFKVQKKTLDITALL